jgi:hypothetical protein
MLIDMDQLIAEQLKAQEKHEVVFADGRKTEVTPVRYVPPLTGEANALSLDGEWRVSRWPFKRAEKALAGPKVNDAKWECVAQPGKVFYADPEAEGKPSVPNWNRVTLAHLDPDDGAMMRRDVLIPRTWKDKRIYLRFDAIYPAGRVYLNGELLGEHLSGLTPVEFDVTGKVVPGRRALVAVRLIRRHRFVQMDMPRHALEFAGLAQSACFHATERCQIGDYHLVSTLDAALATGTLEGHVTIRNTGARPVTASLAVALSNPDGRRLKECRLKVKIGAGATAAPAVSLALRNPALWNDEFPNLYGVTIELAVPGQPRQTAAYRTGFRRLELNPSGPRLNGRPVKFRGVNHLTFHADGGMHTPADWLRSNLLLMKKANVNAIRTHFLGPRCLAELCDELGLYLLQELPIDWGTHYIHDPEWVGPGLLRLQGGILRDRHHPSIMAWSVGNENMPESAKVADDGWHHLRIYDQFTKRLDPSRPTMFPPPGPANKIEGIFEVRVGDIADTHYSFVLAKKFRQSGQVTNPRSWEADMETLTRAEAVARGWSGVWFSSEYGIINMLPDVLNGPYNSIIGDKWEDPICGKNSLQVFIDRLRDEWGDMRSDPTCLGGAYFPWLCCGSGKGPGGNPWGWTRWGEDADWGVVTADLTPKPFFWALRVLFSPVWLPQRLTWKPGETELRFEVANQYNQIDLKDCTLRVQMGPAGRWCGMVREFTDIAVTCAPGATCEVRIPIRTAPTLKGLESGQPAVCRCHLLDPRGFRPLTHDILIVPEKIGGADATAMPVGPDAVL